jgi:hypothetical protein
VAENHTKTLSTIVRNRRSLGISGHITATQDEQAGALVRGYGFRSYSSGIIPLSKVRVTSLALCRGRCWCSYLMKVMPGNTYY